jgi:hypothetical protein
MDLVIPSWISALRGIGVVCNIYNIAKAGDEVIEGLEDKMKLKWGDRRRAKKLIKRHYKGRTAEVNSEQKEVIGMMKLGDSNWKDFMYRNEPISDLSNQISYDSGLDRVISDEPDKDQIMRRTVEGIRELSISIETHKKAIASYELEVEENAGVNESIAKRYIVEMMNLEKSMDDHKLHLATLKMGRRRLEIEGHGRDRVDLSPIYGALAMALESSERLTDYTSHRTATEALDKLNESFDLERELDSSLSKSMYSTNEVNERYDQYIAKDRASDSAKASAMKKGSDLENLVSQAKAQAGV